MRALYLVLLVFASARFVWPADCELDAHGLLTSVSDGALSVSVKDDLVVETTNAVYRISQLAAEKTGAGHYRYRGADASFELVYSSVSGAPFVKRTLTMRFAGPTVLVRVSRDLPTGGAAFLYHTFWNASAAAFLRQDGVGVACGFENPYCALSGGRVSFEPSMELSAGEAFACDADFTGVYALSGERVRPELNASILLRNGRYHPRYRNPDEGIALDRAEIAAMNGYMRDYCAVDAKPFYLTSYQFFSNLAQRPSSAEQRDAYLRNLDGIAALGGDAVILNPLCNNSVPNAEPSSCWGLFPPNSYAAEIRAHAAALGLKTGIYMGTAGTGVHGNSTIIPYANVTAWKKVDLAGASSGENCLACDAFMDWYVAVQTNTIARYALDIWNWDPGPGNGFFCHMSGHGHLPGKGAYKGFRNALRVMKALRDFKPGLYYQGFHGLKEYGSWGFKYMDQHEAFWENDNYDKTPVFADLAADRQTADGIRFQSRWNHDFRFLPPAINHGLAHRMAQACYRPAQDVDLLIDGCGWQYALLSAIAAGGAVTLPIVPRDVSVIPGYKAFYAKWIGWARSHFDWQTAPIGATPYCGGPDGFVKFKDGKCYVFMFNPYPYPLGATVKLDDRVGLSGSGDVSVMRLYPAAASLGRTAKGGDYVLTVPDYGCVVLGFGTSDAVVPAAVTPALPRTLPLTDGAGCRRATFAGSADLRKALATYAPVMTDAAKAAAQDYVSKYNRVNGVWTRPDRLWLWIVPDVLNQASSFSVTLNGRSVTLSRDNLFGVKTLWFADITDLADLDGANELVLAGNAANLTAYLHYPRPETEAIPSAVRTAPSGRFVAPVLDDTLKIQSVELNDGLNVMRPNRENVLRVKLNAADDRIAGVYASTPISLGTPGDALRANMVLDRKGNGVWERRFTTLGRLQLIVDDDKITCWAVTTGHTESASFTLPFEWLLTNKNFVPKGREDAMGTPVGDLLAAIPDVRIFRGDATTTYRDPAVFYENGVFHLFFTYGRIEERGLKYLYVAQSESRDLIHWTQPRILTPKGQNLNYSSPGNVVVDGEDRVLCFQTYPTPDATTNKIVYANDNARLFTMRTRDWKTWTKPELIKVKGDNVAVGEMGRMIDPYLLRDRDDPGLWRCFYKQNGVSFSTSRDLVHWTFVGKANAGENVCVLIGGGRYVMFHSPHNGIGVKTSEDAVHWTDEGPLLTLGQAKWPWASGRITAGAVLDCRKVSGVGKYLMFFHGSSPIDFAPASLGIAWSDDLKSWSWPGAQ